MTQRELQRLREAHLVETEWLASRLTDPRIRTVDMRGRVQTCTAADGYQTAEYLGARDEYLAGHIPGAVYLDWTVDIVDTHDPVPAQIAPAEQVARELGMAGIGDDTLVVAYDSHPASQFATRLWWALKYYGHDDVRVLNGGWTKWVAEGRAISQETPVYPSKEFHPAARPELRATAEQVLSRLGGSDTLVVDARDEGQYSGRIRRGPRGGHIPGAIHLPRERLMAEDGTFLTGDEIETAIQGAGIDPAQGILAYCNGGVAATAVLFALSMVGATRLTNYDGSWNEWSRRPELPMETPPQPPPS